MRELLAILAAVLVFVLVAGPFAFYDAGVHRGLFEPLPPLKYGLVAAICTIMAFTLAGYAYRGVKNSGSKP